MIDYFDATQRWSPEEVLQQALTVIEKASIRATVHADPHSIMCYQIPGTLTKDGKPIVGGRDIDKNDYTFAGAIYSRPNKTSTASKRSMSQRSRSR